MSLAVVSAAWAGGCFQPGALPAPATMNRQPSTGIDLSRRVPLVTPAPFPSPTVPEESLPNAWKPSSPAREWQHLVLHHTAADRGSVESIHRSHLKRHDAAGNPWLGIGYHFVVGNGNGMGDGAIEPTFRWKSQLHGAHAGKKEFNEHGIGIALVGNFDQGPPTPAQVAAVKRLVGILKSEYGIRAENVVGHGDIGATACPGKYFPLSEIIHSDSFPSLVERTGPAPDVRLASAKESRQP